MGRLFSDLYNKRFASHYEDFTGFDKDTVESLFEETKKFLAAVTALLNDEKPDKPLNQ